MNALFARLRISSKIMLAVVLFALLAVFITAYGANRLHSLSGQTQQLVSQQAEGVRLAGIVNTSENRIQQMWLLSVIEHDRADFEAFVAEVAKENKVIDTAMTELEPLLSGPELNDFNTLKQGLSEYRAAVSKIPPLWYADRLDDAQDVLQHDSKDAFATIYKAGSAIVESQRKELATGAAEAQSNASGSTTALIVVSAIGLILIAGAVLWVVRGQIVRPLGAMTDSMGRLASGDHGITVEGDDRTDEIGQMARALSVFRDNAIAQAKTESERTATQAEQKRVVDTLSEALAKLAEGDVTAEIRSEFGSDYAVVRTNFNNAINSLRELIGAVKSSAEMISNGSTEIAAASEDLARRTESNAASLEETTAAIGQMNSRLTATAEAAGRTVSRADQANRVVLSGRTIADEAVQAMGRVSDSAKGIDSVIEGLDKIAFQTRVLAMNAAVEAGRAGEAGRGFAVVADLVSALAMRAEEEAGRARDQLTATQTDVVAAVEMVQKVDGALADISENVGEVHQLLSQMAEDNETQASAIAEVSTAINDMDRSTQQNAAMVEETAAAARNLNNEVNELSRQASNFTVGDEAPRRKAITSAPAPKPARARIEAPTKDLPPAAVSALRVSDQADDWQSF